MRKEKEYPLAFVLIMAKGTHEIAYAVKARETAQRYYVKLGDFGDVLCHKIEGAKDGRVGISAKAIPFSRGMQGYLYDPNHPHTKQLIKEAEKALYREQMISELRQFLEDHTDSPKVQEIAKIIGFSFLNITIDDLRLQAHTEWTKL